MKSKPIPQICTKEKKEKKIIKPEEKGRMVSVRMSGELDEFRTRRGSFLELPAAFRILRYPFASVRSCVWNSKVLSRRQAAFPPTPNIPTN